MQQVPTDIRAAFERRLDRAQVPVDQRPNYHKWVWFYFDFCHKYGHSPAAPTSLGPFKLLGHSDIKTTMIYLQTVPSLTLKEAKSPLDLGPGLTPSRRQASV